MTAALASVCRRELSVISTNPPHSESFRNFRRRGEFVNVRGMIG